MKKFIKLVIFFSMTLIFAGCAETLKQPSIQNLKVEKSENSYYQDSYHQDTTYSLGINMIKTIDSSGNIIKIEKITKDSYRGDSVKEIQLYNVGILESEVTYKNGILDGLLKFYYEDGTICREATYKEGKLNGISIDYSENGYPYRMATFKNGELFGRQVIYNENFEIESEWYIYKDIKLLKPIEKPLEINNKNDSILIQKPIISEDTIKTI